jgi:hypothetical protein
MELTLEASQRTLSTFERLVLFHFQNQEICKQISAILVASYQIHLHCHHRQGTQTHRLQPQQQSLLKQCTNEFHGRVFVDSTIDLDLFCDLPSQINPVSFVTTGDMMEIRGVPKNAISRAFFSGPLGFRERREGTIKSHQNQYPNTAMEISLCSEGAN